MKFFLLIALLLPFTARAHDLDPRIWGDVMFGEPGHPPELDDPALSAVTREFGPSVIPMQSLPIDSGMGVAETKPWSSWWFPKIDTDLFDDGLGTSPLEKYDIYRAAITGKPSHAAVFEKKAYRKDRPHWEGLCDAWAIAATVFPEPIVPRKLKLPNGTVVSFSVSDLKALLLMTVDSVPAESLKTYGQRFTGNHDGWIFPDIFPQELHRYVEKQLFERKRLFIMDHDPGVEVWSEPVYQANYRITAIPGRNDAVFVKLWFYSGTSYTDKTQKDQVGLKSVTREYNYILYGNPDDTGNLTVTWGEWVKGDLVDSRRDHPDFVYAVNGPIQRNSQNPEIDPKIVDQILGKGGL
ncbi:MAG: hypothetical protein ACXVCI_18180, partial [Bdellovibrionota bacterium]